MRYKIDELVVCRILIESIKTNCLDDDVDTSIRLFEHSLLLVCKEY